MYSYIDNIYYLKYRPIETAIGKPDDSPVAPAARVRTNNGIISCTSVIDRTG